MKSLFALILALAAVQSGLTLIERAENASGGTRHPWEWPLTSRGEITPSGGSSNADLLPAGVVSLP